MKKKSKVKKISWILLVMVLIILIIFIKPDNDNKETKVRKQSITDIKDKIDYYNPEYKKRYIDYKKNNSKLDDEQVIKDVNMNLDKIPYKDIKPAKFLNTEIVLVNKYYYLDENFIPDNLENISLDYALSNMRLVHEAKVAFEEMGKKAKEEDLQITAISAYRSYSYQVNLYNRYIKKDGQEKVDTYSGRAGHSEHQTGLAVDVYNEIEDYTNFHKTKEFEWMQEHAYEYGFILRFPEGKEKETGYMYESWHYRYVGKDIAKYIHENNISFEEYYATKIKD